MSGALRGHELLEFARLSGAKHAMWVEDREMLLSELQDAIERINDQIAEHRDIDESELTNPYDPDSESAVERSRYHHWQPPKKKPLPAMLIREKTQLIRLALEVNGDLPAPPRGNKPPSELIPELRQLLMDLENGSSREA